MADTPSAPPTTAGLAEIALPIKWGGFAGLAVALGRRGRDIACLLASHAPLAAALENATKTD